MDGDAVALVESHIALARQCAKKQHRYGVEEWDDVYSDTLLGLWDAARRYDPDRGASFATFAWPRMVGAVGDGRRERDFLSRTQRRAGDIQRPVSFDALIAEDVALGDLIADPSNGIDDLVEQGSPWTEHALVASLLRELPGDDRYVVTRLLDGATLAQIGDEMGFTESRACQISARATDRMRQLLVELPAAS